MHDVFCCSISYCPVTDYVKKTAEQMNNECGIKQFKPTRQVDSLYVCIWIDEPMPLSYGCLFLQVFKDEHEEVKSIQLDACNRVAQRLMLLQFFRFHCLYVSL